MNYSAASGRSINPKKQKQDTPQAAGELTQKRLNLPETIAEKKGIKFIVCLDEFQNLASFKDFLSFEKKLRAFWQRHKSVTYYRTGTDLSLPVRDDFLWI